jgi:hypothetical protein
MPLICKFIIVAAMLVAVWLGIIDTSTDCGRLKFWLGLLVGAAIALSLIP